MPTPRTAERSFAPATSSVRDARRFLTTCLQRWDLEAAVWTCQLLLGELATNAVLHARSTFLVEVAVGARTVRIAVSDTSPVLPHRKRHGVEAGTGRGLGLVELLSIDSGCERHEHGPYRKTVWCELPLDPAALPGPEDGALLATA